MAFLLKNFHAPHKPSIKLEIDRCKLMNYLSKLKSKTLCLNNKLKIQPISNQQSTMVLSTSEPNRKLIALANQLKAFNQFQPNLQTKSH